MRRCASLFLRQEFVFLALVILLGAGVAYGASRTTVLTIAVAPEDGNEPGSGPYRGRTTR